MTDFYTRVSNSLDNYKADQTVIIPKKYLKHISRVNYQDEEYQVPPPIDWYPFTTSYYSYLEDVDAFSRVNYLLGTKPSFESLTSLRDFDGLGQDPYSERQAQIQYLTTNPISFLILGKPELGEQELGRLLADYWGCIYIHPESLIQEEIVSGSRAGKCIEFNLRCGRAIGIDVILRLTEKRVKSKSAQHRGFVICGFPMLPNDLYVEDPLSSESAVFTVQEIFEEYIDTAFDLAMPPIIIPPQSDMYPDEAPGEMEYNEDIIEDDTSVKSAKTVSLPPQQEVTVDIGSAGSVNICGAPSSERNIEDQIDFIFNLFHKPFLIIYIMCSNTDVISQHTDYRFDIVTQQFVDLQREYCDKMVYTYFSRVPGATSDEIPEDFMDLVKNTVELDASNARQLVRMPKDFAAQMVYVLDRFRYSALPVIDRHVMVHDCQYFLKVDGRVSPVRMFHAVKTKLRVLPIQKVCVPKKMVIPSEPTGEGDVAEDLDVENMSQEEFFSIYRAKNIASPMFKWTLTEWGYKCPVSMKEGDYLDGVPKFAVQFMNKIFFLSSESAFLKFSRNPRPYILPPYPKPSCRILVMGPPCCGKTAVAQCLGYLLNGEVLNYAKERKKYIDQMRVAFEDSVRSAALTEGIQLLDQMRLDEWELSEEERREKVHIWWETQQHLLGETVSLTAKLESRDVDVVLEMSSFPVLLNFHANDRTVTGADTTENIEATILALSNLIQENGLPCFDDIGLCARLLENPDLILDYLPPPLQPRDCEIEPATIFDDFVRAHAEQAVRSANFQKINLTSDEIVELIVDSIKGVRESTLEQGFEKDQWIIDGFPAIREVFEKLPDRYRPFDIFVIKESEESDVLRNREVGENIFRDFRTFFMNLGYTDAAWRSPQVLFPDLNTEEIAVGVVDEVLSRVMSAENHENIHRYLNPTSPSSLDIFAKETMEFIDDWIDVEEVLPELEIHVSDLIVTDKSVEEVLKEAVKIIENLFKYVARPFLEEDYARELEDFGDGPEMQGEAGEAEEQEPTEDTFLQNRRFGDTSIYCPVTLHNHWVLWRGKEEYATSFYNKVYLLSSEEAQESFVNDPYVYLKMTTHLDVIPPPRICIVGPKGSGKTSVVEALARNVGLYKIDYLQKVKKKLAPHSKNDLEDILKTGAAGERGAVVQAYLTSDEPLPPEFLNPVIQPLWFEEPMKHFGFVLDGFPSRPSDVDYITTNYTIPDVVIELTIGQSEIEKRLVDKFVEDWNIAADERHARSERKQREILEFWESERKVRFDELMELKKQEWYAARLQEKGGRPENPDRPYLEDLREVDEEIVTSAHNLTSQISYDSVFEEATMAEINEILMREHPEPVFEEEEEEQTLEEAVEKFVVKLEDSYALNLEFLTLTRERCDKELIPWHTVDAGMSQDKVFAQAMRIVEPYKFRNGSSLERVYDISVDLADKLLASGYYFLSKFGKTCPVQIYEDINPVQMFLPLEQKFQLYPVIHRHYIYFLAMRENRDKFKGDPLKYTLQANIKFPLIPLKVAIIGPPKSGKTALAARFKDELGLKLVSRGQAGRYVLTYLPFSELARHIESVIRCGWVMTSEMIIKCVEAMVLDGKSATQGYVFDGFPDSADEVRHLSARGLVPHVVFDLKADRLDIYEFLASDVGKHNLPCFSNKLITNRLSNWLITEEEFREWIDKEYQILAKIPIKHSKWGIWTVSYELATAVFSEIKNYFSSCSLDVALRIANMQISPSEFLERQSSYKHYCPCCLYYDHVLINGGEPPDRTGLIQFRKFYYFLCRPHRKTFIKDPERYTSPYNPRSLPQDLPISMSYKEFPENCYENGLCIVCYWKSQPDYVVKQGNIVYAVVYKEMVYLFDSLVCQQIFIKEPHVYFAKKVSFKGKPYPALNYKELPTLGMLQQYAAKQLTRAIVNTGILRPVIPGLDIARSASLNIAMYLKLNNPKTPSDFLPLYEEAQRKLHERRLNLITYLAQMKKMINPYLYYDEPMPKFADPLFISPTETIYARNVSKSASTEALSQAHFVSTTSLNLQE